MAYPRPAFYPVPVGQMPGPAHPPQNFPGFPRGFQPGKYLSPQPTPQALGLYMPPNGHHGQYPPASAVTTESEFSSEEDYSDSDDDSILDTPPQLQTYYHPMETPRGRSNSRSGAHHRGRSGGHSVPQEHRRLSLPQGIAEHFFHQNGTPHPHPQPILTPFNQALPLPFQHTFDPQQLNSPHGHPGYMHPHPGAIHMPNTPRQPVHPAEHGFYQPVPQPEVIPKPQESRRRSRSMPKGPAAPYGYGTTLNPKWGKDALRRTVIDPTRVSSRTLKGVLIHPLVAPGCRDLMTLNTIRPPAALTAVGNHSLQEYLSDPATSPPMSQLTLWTGVHDRPLTIGNPHGITIGNILGCIGEMMFSKIKRVAWDAFTEQRRTEIADWFHHNREIGLMPPAEKGVRHADLLGPNTMFFGLELCKQLPNQPTPPGTFMIRWGPPI